MNRDQKEGRREPCGYIYPGLLGKFKEQKGGWRDWSIARQEESQRSCMQRGGLGLANTGLLRTGPDH